MEVEKLVEAHELTAVRAKEFLVSVMKDRIDLPPNCMVWWDDGSAWGGRPGAMTHMLPDDADAYDVAATSTEMLRRRLRHEGREVKAVGFVFTSDCYALAVEQEAGQPMPIIDMQESFRNDPASPVSEAVVTYYVCDDLVGGCDVYSVTTPYSYGDGLQIIWKEHQVMDPTMECQTGGPLYERFQRMWKEITS